MHKFDVYAYGLPKVTDDGQSILPAPHRTQQFNDLQEAKEFAEALKNDFERIAVIQTVDGDQTLLERFSDGERFETLERAT